MATLIPTPKVRRVDADTVGLPPMFELASVTVTPSGEGRFQVTIHNASDTSMGLQTPFAPGVFVVHTGGEPLYTEGSPDRGDGLEALAEDGNPSLLAAALETEGMASGVFAVPDGASDPAPAFPG